MHLDRMQCSMKIKTPENEKKTTGGDKIRDMNVIKSVTDVATKNPVELYRNF